VKWQLGRFPDEDKLDLSKTFEQQMDHVNRIIVPAIMESLNKLIFPVTNNIVYSMVHSLHRHRREEYKIKESSPECIDKQKRRRHANSRRNSVILLISVLFHNNLSLILCAYSFFFAETKNQSKND
jgi:nitrate reductase gamma subunit